MPKIKPDDRPRLTDRVSPSNMPPTRGEGPLWKGPSEDGITFSMLSRFLVCRERFRVEYIEGLRPVRTFNHKIEYGQMWHVCEEAIASEVIHFGEVVETSLWSDNLKNYCENLVVRYPDQRDQIEHWFNVCRMQFPLYLKHWSGHKDMVARLPLFQEKVFDVQYTLPSGRKVRLRGKWDSVDVVSRDGRRSVWLQENKTKSDIDAVSIQRQLTFDLQTMIYMTSLQAYKKLVGMPKNVPIAGVRYNVVRRPLSGGKGSIVRHKATKNHPEETKQAYYERASEYIKEAPGEFFMRWDVSVTPADINVFRLKCLDPLLEQVCDWWEWINTCIIIGISPFDAAKDPHEYRIHWQHPFGVYNSLDQGGHTDLDAYLSGGSEVGLERVERLFEEL